MAGTRQDTRLRLARSSDPVTDVKHPNIHSTSLHERSSKGNARIHPLRQPLRLLLVPGLVLALGLFATYGLWSSARQESRHTLQDELQFWTDKVAYGIEDRLNGYVQVLRGVVGLFEASISVDRQEFQRYILALALEERHPGAQGSASPL